MDECFKNKPACIPIFDNILLFVIFFYKYSIYVFFTISTVIKIDCINKNRQSIYFCVLKKPLRDTANLRILKCSS